MESRWRLHMSTQDIVNNKEGCPKHIAEDLRLELDKYWDGAARRVVKHVDRGSGWTVQVLPSEGCTYIAMSYCWKDGSPKVGVEGIEWEVEEWNLQALLRVYRNLDKVVLYCNENGLHIESAERVAVWCDAVCIDQRDGSTDKEEQVPIMGKIYRRAECVVVPCIVVDTFPSVQKVLGNEYVRNCDVFGSQHVTEGVDSVFENGYFDDMWTWLRQLASEDWWSRQWTLQEACCSRVLLFMAKDGSIIDASILFTMVSIVRDCLSNKLLKSSMYDGLQAVNRMAAQFLMISLLVCTARYCPLLPAANVFTMSMNRECREAEDRIYAVLGMVGVKMLPEYGIGLEEATKRFYSSCISQGDHSVIFCVGERLHRWQMRIDRYRFYIGERYSASVEQGINIDVVDDGKLRFSFNGDYSAALMRCVYKEGDDILSTVTRFYRVLERSVKLGFSITESYSMFDEEAQHPVFVMCFVIHASIQGNEALDMDYVSRIFSDMKEVVANSSPYLDEHRDDLLGLLASPETGKGNGWIQGLRILHLVYRCRLTEGLQGQVIRYYMNTYRIIAHFGDPDICTVALAVFEINGLPRAPTCLVLSRALASEAGDYMLAVPTGYNMNCGEPLILAGSHRHDMVGTDIEAVYIGIPVVRRGLSLVMRACRVGCKSLTFV